jgi:hypothetical protein
MRRIPKREPNLAEAVAARAAGLAAALVAQASAATLLHAASAPTDSAFVGALADLILESGRVDPVAAARLRGRIALAAAIEDSGGAWSADQAQIALGVGRTTLQNWREQGRVLALEAADGSFLYPVAQFAQPASDLTAPRPYRAIADIVAAARGAVSTEELVAMLAVPQAMLTDISAHPLTPFAALAAGQEARAVELVRWAAAAADADAPDAPDDDDQRGTLAGSADAADVPEASTDEETQSAAA